MEVWLWGIIGVLTCAIVILAMKLYLFRKSAREIREGLADRLTTETNTLLTVSTRDKTMRKLAESINDELRILRRQRHRFQQGDLELKEAVANVSHDLRTPLTAICGYLELLRETLRELSAQGAGKEGKLETAGRYLDIIENRTEVMKQLTEELFRYSVVVSASHSFSREDVILNHALEESISAYYAALKAADITPDISMPEQKISRSLDANALSRIFGNIISNAIKYSDGDLQIILSESGEIIFANHASGLNEVEAGKLFDRFYTVETAKKSTGLGLSIAKTLTEQIGGRITAEYEDGVLRICVRF